MPSLTKNRIAAFSAIALLALAASSFHGPDSFVSAQQAGGAATPDAEREQAWNSSDMLRARSWVQDYCQGSNAVSEEQAAEHMSALESMTPAQMKLFAALHAHAANSHPAALTQQAHQAALGHAQQAAAAQQWWMANVHKAQTNQALAANQATQAEYSAINSEESAAAGQEQSQLNTEQAAAREMQESKQDDLNTANLGVGAGWPYGYPSYGGGIHYHFHAGGY